MSIVGWKLSVDVREGRKGNGGCVIVLDGWGYDVFYRN